ncbi:helix-turn-helix domain-containing protein [Nocardiopsis metallicus]|uniref:Transcriptional regulator with XRE-family HTH domain n=1 Tax=Nocardiopsis metallicus TaxID=179819 RepID=A0A840WCZ0_9ACTN|nr:helix-turn-helix transcriptional regulator [Nocardiopsis metallicus]MBB5494880.1 transcriptional regulator with XRE-family HTH domain [Nocardiopsis metallicus]
MSVGLGLESMPKSGVSGWKPSVLRAARAAQDWSLTEVGERIGIDRSLVGRYEKEGGSAPSPQVLRKLAEVFGVSPTEFIDDAVGLVKYRAVLGLSQGELVDKLQDPDLTIQTYGRLESGRTRKLRAAQAKTLAVFFGVSEDEVRAAHERNVQRRQQAKADEAAASERTT